MKGASDYLKPVVLELGGKDPMVICEDADLDPIIPIVTRGVYQNSGQNCCGIERVVVHDSLHDTFVARVKSLVDKFRQGPALGPEQVAPSSGSRRIIRHSLVVQDSRYPLLLLLVCNCAFHPRFPEIGLIRSSYYT